MGNVRSTAFLAILATLALGAHAAPAADPSRPDHVVIVIEENKAFEQVIDNPAAPYLNSLAHLGALFTQSHAVGHPSQPNYLALFSGSMQGITDDTCPQQFSNDNLAADLVRHKLRFAIYAEALPETGYTGCHFARYFRKHNPAVNWLGVNVTGTQIQRFADFPSDFAKLPEVSFVIPDIINDMHDDQPPASIATGDAWLRSHMGAYARWALHHNSILIVTWDEDDNQHGNRIPTIAFGEPVKSGQYDMVFNHYDVLRTLTTWYGLDDLPGLASTHAITEAWRTTSH